MARRKAPIIPDELLDQLLAGRDPQSALGRDGLVDALKRALAERALNAEMDHHLDGEALEGRSNSRNGYGRKTLLTETGKLPIAVPRDRLATFEPQLIAKYRRRLPGFDGKVISMYARGLSVPEIQGHLAELYGIDVSPDLISTVTDAVLEEVATWQSRPLEPIYPLVFFDALRVKIRDEGLVRNKAVHVALGVQADGTKEILGLWLEQNASVRLAHRSFADGAGKARWRQILAQGHERAQEPRRRRRADRRRRRPQGLSRSDHGGVPGCDRSDLHRPPPQARLGLRLLQGSQGRGSGFEGSLPGGGRHHGRSSTRRLRGQPLGPEISCHRPKLAPRLG